MATRSATNSSRSFSARLTTSTRRPCGSSSVARKQNPRRVALLVLDHHHSDGGISEQLEEREEGEERGGALVDARPHLLHHLLDVIACSGALREQTVRLALQGGAGLHHPDPRVDRYPLAMGRWIAVGADSGTMMAPVVT
jgi:hypothetical protein